MTSFNRINDLSRILGSVSVGIFIGACRTITKYGRLLCMLAVGVFLGTLQTQAAGRSEIVGDSNCAGMANKVSIRYGHMTLPAGGSTTGGYLLAQLLP